MNSDEIDEILDTNPVRNETTICPFGKGLACPGGCMVCDEGVRCCSPGETCDLDGRTNWCSGFKPAMNVRSEVRSFWER